MSKGLDLAVIAEGVDKISQKEFLLSSGSYEIQGYLYQQPAVALDNAITL